MEVYREPADTFVAGFLASPPMNLLEARIEADGAARGLVVICDAALRVPLSVQDESALGAYRDRAVILGIRPEDLREECGVPGMHPVDLQVVAVEALGPEAILIGSLGGPRAPELAARMGAEFSARVGTEQRLWIDPAAVHLFDAATGKSIPRPQAAPRDSRSDHALRAFQRS
jgi:multiple sugar transport system ATP-binding protein